MVSYMMFAHTSRVFSAAFYQALWAHEFVIAVIC